jgi:hypothetical protein
MLQANAECLTAGLFLYRSPVTNTSSKWKLELMNAGEENEVDMRPEAVRFSFSKDGTLTTRSQHN